jgi:hypothetical protein
MAATTEDILVVFVSVSPGVVLGHPVLLRPGQSM